MMATRTEKQSTTHEIELIDWGRRPYREAWDAQRERVEQRQRGDVANALILVEHDPVYTYGARPGASNHLLWDDSLRTLYGIDLVRTNRGGDITYHGPGQIVGYPILDLRPVQDLHRYLRSLEQVLINALGTLGLATSRREGKTGIWLQDRKIAAIGVAVKSWISWHGFALNVRTDLKPFEGIVPCGITDGTVTSMEKELGAACPEIEEVKEVLSAEFRQIFSPEYFEKARS